jgi:hypothetical protein
MHVSDFMNARAVTRCPNPNRAIAAHIAAYQFRKPSLVDHFFCAP